VACALYNFSYNLKYTDEHPSTPRRLLDKHIIIIIIVRTYYIITDSIYVKFFGHNLKVFIVATVIFIDYCSLRTKFCVPAPMVHFLRP
jgi:hypothetical protein